MPTLARQRIAGPSFGQGLNQLVSGEMPSRFAPRKRGHSAALVVVDEANRQSASSRKALLCFNVSAMSLESRQFVQASMT